MNIMLGLDWISVHFWYANHKSTAAAISAIRSECTYMLEREWLKVHVCFYVDAEADVADNVHKSWFMDQLKYSQSHLLCMYLYREVVLLHANGSQH